MANTVLREFRKHLVPLGSIILLVFASPAFGQQTNNAPMQPVQAAPVVQPVTNFAPANDTATAIESQAAVDILSPIADRFSPLSNAFSLADAPGAVVAPGTGLAGGDGGADRSWWTSLSNSWIENTLAATATEGAAQTATIGVDYKFSPTVTAGVSFNYSHSNIDTNYIGGKNTTKGGSVVPYVNIVLNDWLSADFSAGYSFSDTDMRRPVGISGSSSTNGWLGAANLNAAKWSGLWLYSGKVSLFANSSDTGSFTESDFTVHSARSNNLVQGSVTASVAYWMEPVMPYLSVTYAYDFKHENPTTPGASNDRDEFKIGAGANFYGTGQWKDLTLGFGVTTTLGRKDTRNTTASINLRYAF